MLDRYFHWEMVISDRVVFPEGVVPDRFTVFHAGPFHEIHIKFITLLTLSLLKTGDDVWYIGVHVHY